MDKVIMPKEVKEYFASGRRTIKKIVPNEDYSLTLSFDNGEVRIYKMNDMLYGIFEVLKDKTKFKQVFLDENGNIAWDIDENIDSKTHWNNRIDLCTDSVYLNSKQIS